MLKPATTPEEVLVRIIMFLLGLGFLVEGVTLVIQQAQMSALEQKVAYLEGARR